MGCGSERNNQQPLCLLPLGPWRQVANCVSTKSHPCPSAPCLVQAPRPPLPYADTTEDGGTKRHKVVETTRSSARRKVNLSDGQQELPLPPSSPSTRQWSCTFTFQDTNSKHLYLIFTASTVFTSKLQNFRAPGPYYVKSEQWQIGILSY